MDPNAAMTGIVAASGGVGLAVYLYWKLRESTVWRQVAEQLQLESSLASGQRVLKGRVGGYPVVIETVVSGSGDDKRTSTRILLQARGSIHPKLALKAESAWEGLKKVFTGKDLQLDDATFDKAVLVQGPEDVTLAALDAKARQEVLRLVAHRAEVVGGDLRFEGAGILRDAGRMVDIVQSMVWAAKALRVSSVTEALARNAGQDPNPGVRRRNLEALAKHHPKAKACREALRRALGDPDVGVRLFAAGALRSGPEVKASLEALLADRASLEPQRVEALDLLVESFAWPELASAIAQALDGTSDALRVAAVKAAGKARDGAALLARKAMAWTKDAPLGVALADALREVGGTEGEAMLLALLKSESREVQVAAAKALASTGTVRAVEPLLPLAGVLADGAIREAARDAVRAIQSRLGDADGGRLSVVDAGGTEGGLSVEPGSRREPQRG